MILQDHQPFIRKLHLITKDYFGVLTHLLDHLDIDRYFYPLMLICNANSGLTQKALSEFLGIDKVTMSRIAEYLVQQGYVTRESNPDDRRTTVLKATKKAMKEVQFIEKAFSKIDERLFENVSDEEREGFLKVVDRINVNMLKMPKGQVKFDYKKIQSK
jgi:DNA-binding MarR family transcriptional regulator